MSQIELSPPSFAQDVTAEAGAAVMRFVLTLAGVALTVSAFGLWLVPGAKGMPELTLIKLGMSLCMLISGLCCLACARQLRRRDGV